MPDDYKHETKENYQGNNLIKNVCKISNSVLFNFLFFFF